MTIDISRSLDAMQSNEILYNYWKEKVDELKKQEKFSMEKILQFDFKQIENMPERDGLRTHFIDELFQSHRFSKEENDRRDKEMIPLFPPSAVRMIWPYLNLRQIKNFTDEQIAELDFSKLEDKKGYSYFYSWQLIEALFITNGELNERKLNLLSEENRWHVSHALSTRFPSELETFKRKKGISDPFVREDQDPLKGVTGAEVNEIPRIKEISGRLLNKGSQEES